MHFISALSAAGVTWTLEPSDMPHEVFPDRRLPSLKVSVVTEPGATPIFKHFRATTQEPLESLVALTMKEHCPTHPVLQKWSASRGDVPVKLSVPVAEMAYIGEPVHTGLRKLADSASSVITWNALHLMAADDRVALWQRVGFLLQEAFSKDAAPSRRNVAERLRRGVTQFLKDRRYASLTPARTPEQSFALLMMTAGCEVTDFEEWMWAWLGYVVEDLPAQPGASRENVASPA